MDREKDLINKFKNFQEDILKILQNSEKDRNKWKSQVDGLMISSDVLQERYNEEHAENVRLRETVTDLQRNNVNLQEQVNNLLAERQKLTEQLELLRRNDPGGSEERIAIAEHVSNVNRELKLTDGSRKSASSIDRREEKDVEVNDEIASIQEDYSFTTQFSPARNEKLEYDDLMNLDSPFTQLAEKFDHQDKNTSAPRNDANNEKEEPEVVAGSSNADKNEKPPVVRRVADSAVETTNYGDYFIDSDNDEKTPEKKIFQNLEKSPDLRDQSSKKRKNSSSTSLEARLNESVNKSIPVSPIRVVEPSWLLKPKNTTFIGKSSSSKRTAMEDSDIFNTPGKKFKSPDKRNETTPRKNPLKLTFSGTPKKSPVRLRKTPKKSPARTSQLKKSHLLDAEKTFGGMRKMTQTKLNLDHFSNKKRDEKENQSAENKKSDFFQPSDNFTLENKKDDDDDLIFGSPHVKSKSLTEIKSKPGSSKVNKEPSQSLLNDDPEATYVSSLFVKNWKKNKIFDDDILEVEEEKLPKPRVDLSPTERIPDLNPVPDSPAYKRGAVRKKADRMKLPGRVCYQCEDYYRSVYGDNINPRELQKILDQCSRHRDKHPDPETPPGFWKPYLTMTPEEKEK